jgi:protein-tyrosine phosphatase
MITPSRLVPLSGTTNFRDLGGYVGHHGRFVQWRKLFRSDHLGALSSGDILMLSDLLLFWNIK